MRGRTLQIPQAKTKGKGKGKEKEEKIIWPEDVKDYELSGDDTDDGPQARPISPGTFREFARGYERWDAGHVRDPHNVSSNLCLPSSISHILRLPLNLSSVCNPHLRLNLCASTFHLLPKLLSPLYLLGLSLPSPSQPFCLRFIFCFRPNLPSSIYIYLPTFLLSLSSFYLHLSTFTFPPSSSLFSFFPPNQIPP